MRPLLIIAITALCVAGCGKSPSERLTDAALSAATGQKVSVDKDGGQVTIKGDHGDMQIASGAAAALPADFPKDVYLPERYTVESAMRMPNAQVLALDASGDITALSAEASRRMQAQGWKQTMAMQQDGSNQMFAFEKDQRSAMLTFDRQGDAVKVGHQLTTKL